MESLTKNKLVLPSLRGVLGDWVYYSTIMTASQVSEWIEPAKEIRETKQLDELLQRDLKDRKEGIAKYLLSNENRFFNSIIVGVYGGIPDWIEFDISRKIEELGNSKDSGFEMGLISFTGEERMFAIDGQHRVAGIEIATKIDNSQNEKDRVLTNDRFSVILLAHIDDEKGRKRTRRLFSDINKNAHQVAKADRIKIDEDDICAIVTRRIFAKYQYFDGGKLISLSEKSNIESKDISNFTNIDTLYSVNQKLKKLFKLKKGTKESDEINVQEFFTIVTQFYDYLIENLDTFKKFFVDKTITLHEVRLGNKNILYRPIGLILVAKLYTFYKSRNSLTKLSKILSNLSFTMPQSPFNKVLWVNGKMQALAKNQTLAFDLILYIYGDYSKNTGELLQRYKDVTKNDSISLPTKQQL